MPGLDRTGPEGKGSRTGRGLGKCKPNNKNSEEQNDLEDFPRGRGLGLGRKRGRGFGRGRF